MDPVQRNRRGPRACVRPLGASQACAAGQPRDVPARRSWRASPRALPSASSRARAHQALSRERRTGAARPRARRWAPRGIACTVGAHAPPARASAPSRAAAARAPRMCTTASHPHSHADPPGRGPMRTRPRPCPLGQPRGRRARRRRRLRQPRSGRPPLVRSGWPLAAPPAPWPPPPPPQQQRRRRSGRRRRRRRRVGGQAHRGARRAEHSTARVVRSDDRGTREGTAL